MANAPVWIYGVNSVFAMLESRPEAILEVYISERKDNWRLSEIGAAAHAADIACTEKPAQALEKITSGGSHQGVAALCRLPACLGERDLKSLCEGAPVFLILDGVTDPANLGACLRSAEACAATAVIVAASNTAELTPAAVKAASGAVGRIPLVRLPNLARAIGLLKQEGVWVVAVHANADRQLREIDCCLPTVFVLGGEGTGLRRRTAELCDASAAISMRGRVENLNVSVAAAICLYEMRRQRDKAT